MVRGPNHTRCADVRRRKSSHGEVRALRLFARDAHLARVARADAASELKSKGET
jgi:hypothetical protein